MEYVENMDLTAPNEMETMPINKPSHASLPEDISQLQLYQDLKYHTDTMLFTNQLHINISPPPVTITPNNTALKKYVQHPIDTLEISVPTEENIFTDGKYGGYCKASGEIVEMNEFEMRFWDEGILTGNG